MEKGADGAKDSVTFKPLIRGLNDGVYVQANAQWGGYLTLGSGSNDHYKKSISFVPHKNEDGSWWLTTNHESPDLEGKYVATWGGTWFSRSTYYKAADGSGDRSALKATVVDCPVPA